MNETSPAPISNPAAAEYIHRSGEYYRAGDASDFFVNLKKLGRIQSERGVSRRRA
ncbi:hypothetical protein R80B4_02153 [Fibrobacteres bacterium R8-0-B4]